MVILIRYLAIASFLLVLSCSTTDTSQKLEITDVYVADFQSDDLTMCGTADVDLTHSEAKTFFQRAKQVDYKILHDHYEIASCFIEGTLTMAGKPCEWNIRAGATGMISCGDNKMYFACDDCESLFTKP